VSAEYVCWYLDLFFGGISYVADEAVAELAETNLHGLPAAGAVDCVQRLPMEKVPD
jgi:uncharacterized protein (UPF0261 family)